jgi:hypothetical protein
MATEIICPARFFQLWSYSVSHSELLLRSTKSAEFPTRIDVFFKGVKEVHLPITSSGLSITEACDTEIQRLHPLRRSPLDKDVKVFMVQGEDFTGYVAALIALYHEDEGEYNEPSFFAHRAAGPISIG